MATENKSLVSRIRNFSDKYLPGPFRGNVGTKEGPQARNISRYIMPLQLQRLAHDVSMWRGAIAEAENAWYPHRIKMQRMYIDTILDGQVRSAMRRRKGMTLQKEIVLVREDGVVDEQWSKVFKEKWFRSMCSYILDAQFYGYSLIEFGDMKVSGRRLKFPDLKIVKRWNVSPDRCVVSSIPYQVGGVNFLNDTDSEGNKFSEWSMYIDTPTDTGESNCGYGLLYEVALHAIFAKNNLAHNASYTEMYGQPYRHGKTTGTLDDDRRNMLENSLRDMGATGWLLTDDGIELEFHETSVGTGYKAYDNLDNRCKAMINKLILGHANAMDEEAGKLGAGKGEDNPVLKAMRSIEKDQATFLFDVLNDQFLDKMRAIGVPVPADLKFQSTNDEEKFEVRKREDEANMVTAEVFKTISDSGGRPDWKYFTERTGIKVEENVQIEEAQPRTAIETKLNNIYRIGRA